MWQLQYRRYFVASVGISVLSSWCQWISMWWAEKIGRQLGRCNIKFGLRRNHQTAAGLLLCQYHRELSWYVPPDVERWGAGMEMQPSGAGYPQRRKVRCGVGGGLLHERLLAIEFLDYSFKTMFVKVFFLRCLHHLFMFSRPLAKIFWRFTTPKWNTKTSSKEAI